MDLKVDVAEGDKDDEGVTDINIDELCLNMSACYFGPKLSNLPDPSGPYPRHIHFGQPASPELMSSTPSADTFLKVSRSPKKEARKGCLQILL